MDYTAFGEEIQSGIGLRDSSQGFASNINFVSVSKNKDSKYVLSFYHNNIEFDRSNIKFISAEKALIYMADSYAFTVNSGRTWKVENVGETHPNCLIKLWKQK